MERHGSSDEHFRFVARAATTRRLLRLSAVNPKEKVRALRGDASDIAHRS
jgi:hypothetical protein